MKQANGNTTKPTQWRSGAELFQNFEKSCQYQNFDNIDFDIDFEMEEDIDFDTNIDIEKILRF